MSGKYVMSFEAEWLFDAIHYAEDPSLSKGYELSFAGGSSGVSFGAMQIDLATNSQYREGFVALMEDSGKFSVSEMSKISDLIELPATQSQWALLEGRVEEVLSSNVGRTTVDGMNERYFQETFSPYIERLFSAARDNPEGLGSLSQDHPDYQESLAYMAAWVNRTGEPTIILNLMTGESTGEAPSLAGIKDYISNSKQFKDKENGGNGEDFSKWSVRIENAVKYANSKNPTEMGDYGGNSFYLSIDKHSFSDIDSQLHNFNDWGPEETWHATIFSDTGEQFDILFKGNEKQFDIFLEALHRQSYISNQTTSWVKFLNFVPIHIDQGTNGSGNGFNQDNGVWISGNYDWDWDWEADWEWESGEGEWGSGAVTSSSWLDS